MFVSFDASTKPLCKIPPPHPPNYTFAPNVLSPPGAWSTGTLPHYVFTINFGTHDTLCRHPVSHHYQTGVRATPTVLNCM